MIEFNLADYKKIYHTPSVSIQMWEGKSIRVFFTQHSWVDFETVKLAIDYVYKNCSNNLSLEDTLKLTKLYNEHKELKI